VFTDWSGLQSCYILSQSDITKDAREENAMRACSLGNSTACLTSGLKAMVRQLLACDMCLYAYLRTRQDNHQYEDARQLLQQACEQSKDGGHPGGCYRLGMLLATGDRLPEDPARCVARDQYCLLSALFCLLSLLIISQSGHSISSARAAGSAIRSRASTSCSTKRTRASESSQRPRSSHM
jgi:hypothetical protein